MEIHSNSPKLYFMALNCNFALFNFVSLNYFLFISIVSQLISLFHYNFFKLIFFFNIEYQLHDFGHHGDVFGTEEKNVIAIVSIPLHL